MRIIYLATFFINSCNNNISVGNRPVGGDGVGLDAIVANPKVVVAAVDGECSKVENAHPDMLT